MDERDEQRQAAEALATIQVHQDRAQRAARLPWWVYLAMFLLGVVGGAIDDVTGRDGSKVVAAVILVALVVVFVTSAVTRSSLLGKVRGVQRRQVFVPWVFGVVVVVGGLGAWLISRYGNGFATGVAGAIGLGRYPDTVIGVLYGAVFTALFALVQLLLATSRRTSR